MDSKDNYMPERSLKDDDPLEDFAPRAIALQGVTKRVYVAGSGPAVIVCRPSRADATASV